MTSVSTSVDRGGEGSPASDDSCMDGRDVAMLASYTSSQCYMMRKQGGSKRAPPALYQLLASLLKPELF